MNASEYKKQFLAFLITAYPDGLPLDFTQLVLAVGDFEFVFPIDLDDYYKALGYEEAFAFEPEPSEPIKKVTKTARKKVVKRPKVDFDSLLNEKDLELLGGMKISLKDGKG